MHYKIGVKFGGKSNYWSGKSSFPSWNARLTPQPEFSGFKLFYWINPNRNKKNENENLGFNVSFNTKHIQCSTRQSRLALTACPWNSFTISLENIKIFTTGLQWFITFSRVLKFPLHLPIATAERELDGTRRYYFFMHRKGEGRRRMLEWNSVATRENDI